MSSRRMFWRLFPTYIGISLISIVAVIWYSSHVIYSHYLEWVTADLTKRAQLMKTIISPNFDNPTSAVIDSLCVTNGLPIETRITVVLPDGTVLGDTYKNPDDMERHDTRPEIATALSGHIGTATRYSNTLQQQLVYVAIPIMQSDTIAGVVRASVPLKEISAIIRDARGNLIFAGIIILILAALISLWISRGISRPLEELKAGAEQFASGDLNHRLQVSSTEEIGSLALTLNKMAQELNKRIEILASQRNEQEAILTSMVEGVIAIDSSARIINLNKAAAKLLGIDYRASIGHTIHQLARNSDLIRLIDNCLLSDMQEEGVITLNEKHIQLRCTRLHDTTDRKIGTLIIVNDITRLKKLETMRSDFVANVSHELRTPITAIKGFVETLLHNPTENTDDTKRFLAIIARQADRLNAIIEDLLSLSRIEQDAEGGEIVFERSAVCKVIESAIQSCQVQAETKNITLNLECDEHITAMIDAPLLEQAVINLIDNAIKYSNDNDNVDITVKQLDGEMTIQIRDYGCGIAEEHLPRLFERFYRVDKARSRELGGTGLGLAIVKHIVKAHGGTVTVDSVIGQGSTFTIHLPNTK